jgi:3',5'-cyclic AMP phosphodiesterase CpdA
MQKSLFKLCVAAALAVVAASPAQAAPWKFAIMSDTQWKSSPDGKNPNTVAVNVVRHLEERFVAEGVRFVVQVGDLTDDGSKLALDTRATFAQELYDHGIGFYPLRGNHESSSAGGAEFRRIFPQTQTGLNNVTPADAQVTTLLYGVPPAVTTPTFQVGTGFASYPGAGGGYAGLFYSFDFENARLVLLDQFTPSPAASHAVLDADQIAWVGDRLAARPAGAHAFVFGHKGLITENHADTLFGNDPSYASTLTNQYMAALQANGVRYHVGGHDHMHNRALVASPDRRSTVQNVIAASDSFKFYIPQVPGIDARYDVPPRETELAQELFTVGYYIVTVDGPRVTVDYWASPNGCSGDCDLTTDLIPYAFTKRETFGYALNGHEFLVPSGGSYTGVADAFQGTSARILDGQHGSGVGAFDGRPVAHAVNTGWEERACGTASAALTLWGMSSMVPGLDADETDPFVLEMSFARGNGHWKLGTGAFGLQRKDATGAWVPAAAGPFVVGPWVPGAVLGTYGVDPATRTAWAVVDRQGEYRVASFDGAVTDQVCALEGR